MKRIIWLLAVVIGMAGAVQAGKLRSGDELNVKRYSVGMIYQELYDLDGKVVMIPFRPWNLRQVAADMYTCNLDESGRVALLRIPGVMYRKWWVQKGTRRPGAIYVRVSRGTLVNNFGVEQEGAILLALGSSKSTDIRGRQSFTW